MVAMDYASIDGCFYYDEQDGHLKISAGSVYGWREFKIDASRSSNRYSDSATEVNPLYESCKFYIKT